MSRWQFRLWCGISLSGTIKGCEAFKHLDFPYSGFLWGKGLYFISHNSIDRLGDRLGSAVRPSSIGQYQYVVKCAYSDR